MIAVRANPLEGYDWPPILADEEMNDALRLDDFSVKPFSPPRGVSLMGMEVLWNGPYGPGVAKYMLIREQRLEPEWPSLKATWKPDFSTDEPLKVKNVTIHTWRLVSVKQPTQRSYSDMAFQMADMIPGIWDDVPSPCKCLRGDDSIWGTIIHLNDEHHPDMVEYGQEDSWSRERIADWLEALDADLVLDPEFSRKKARRSNGLPEIAVSADEAAKTWTVLSKAVTKMTTDVNKLITNMAKSFSLNEKTLHTQSCICKICIPNKEES